MRIARPRRVLMGQAGIQRIMNLPAGNCWKAWLPTARSASSRAFPARRFAPTTFWWLASVQYWERLPPLFARVPEPKEARGRRLNEVVRSRGRGHTS